ncbi:MAG: ATP-binding protein [Chlorobi bacterium]|nr:ATP-binding protein [Chlorobiota bacterium]
MEKILYQYNPHWEAKAKTYSYFKRGIILQKLINELNNKQVTFITGLRRIGKTTIMRMIIDYLIEKMGVKASVILYISLDNYIISKSAIAEIVEAFRKIHRLKHDDFVYLFFDEVTYQKDYEIQLKNLYDFGNCKIFVSSSNASLLRSGKPYLTGRNRIFELLPLDFGEYLEFKNIKIRKSDSYLLEEYFKQFLNTGGIPEYVLHNDVTYIHELVDDIINKDIAAQYKVRNPGILQDYYLLLMERAGKQVSINKVAAILKISTETSKRYLQYFANSFLIYTINRKGKTNEQLLAPKKIYAADIGMRNFYTGFRDIGSLFENYIYLKIKHLNPQYIYQDAAEIDFITKDNDLIEAKYHNQNLSVKQQKLFDNYNARKKLVIRNQEQIASFLKEI